MAEPQEPLTQLVDEATTVAKRRLISVRDWGAKWAGAQLLKIVLGGVGIGGLLWVAFPWAVAAGGAFVVAAAVGYAVYCRKQLVEERTMRRRAFVSGIRVQQQALRSELALRQVAIGLAGTPDQRRRFYEVRAPGVREVKQAADFVAARSRAYVASVDESPRAQAARRRGGSAPPKAPDIAPWIRRAGVLEAEIKELEARIQALSVPGAPELEEALRKTQAERQAAHEADRVARERHRAGRTPSPEQAESHLVVRQQLDGSTDVSRASGPATPEQIAEPPSNESR